MTAEKLFSTAEKERIQAAVMAAEQKTAGEIVPMVVTASARYTEVELLGTVLGLGIGTLAAYIVHDPWSLQTVHLWPMLAAGVGFFACRVPSIKRRLVSAERRQAAVAQRGLSAFGAEGVHATRDHNGILIFISLLEREVDVLADHGIDAKVPAGTWEEVVGELTAGLRSGRACDALCKAIDRCGVILADHFPRRDEDADELQNKLILGD